MGRDAVTSVTRAEGAQVLRFKTEAQGQALDVMINLWPSGALWRSGCARHNAAGRRRE